MICEGRILEKFERKSITVDCRMLKILDAMNYHRIVTNLCLCKYKGGFHKKIKKK